MREMVADLHLLPLMASPCFALQALKRAYELEAMKDSRHFASVFILHACISDRTLAGCLGSCDAARGEAGVLTRLRLLNPITCLTDPQPAHGYAKLLSSVRLAMLSRCELRHLKEATNIDRSKPSP